MVFEAAGFFLAAVFFVAVFFTGFLDDAVLVVGFWVAAFLADDFLADDFLAGTFSALDFVDVVLAFADEVKSDAADLVRRDTLPAASPTLSLAVSAALLVFSTAVLVAALAFSPAVFVTSRARIAAASAALRASTIGSISAVSDFPPSGERLLLIRKIATINSQRRRMPTRVKTIATKKVKTFKILARGPSQIVSRKIVEK